MPRETKSVTLEKKLLVHVPEEANAIYCPPAFLVVQATSKIVANLIRGDDIILEWENTNVCGALALVQNQVLHIVISEKGEIDKIRNQKPPQEPSVETSSWIEGHKEQILRAVRNLPEIIENLQEAIYQTYRR
jgi:hypothetical protein